MPPSYLPGKVTHLCRFLITRQRVARMIHELSRTTQVIAVSHHKEFHALADHVIRLHASDSRTHATHDH